MKRKNTVICINCRKSYQESPEEANGYGTCSSCEQKIMDCILKLPETKTSVKKKNDFVPLKLAKQIRKHFATYYGTSYSSREHARRRINRKLNLTLTRDRFSAITAKSLMERDGLKLRDEIED